MVPDPDQHSWDSDVFGHGWRAFSITTNGYTRDPMRRISEGLNSTLQTAKNMTELRRALLHLQRHDHWQGINDDEILKDEVCELLRLIRMKLAVQRKGPPEQQERMRMTNPNLDLFNQALALVQQWPNDPNVARRLRGIYDQAEMTEAYQVGQFVEALWVAAETSEHIELINCAPTSPPSASPFTPTAAIRPSLP